MLEALSKLFHFRLWPHFAGLIGPSAFCAIVFSYIPHGRGAIISLLQRILAGGVFLEALFQLIFLRLDVRLIGFQEK